MPLAGLTAVDCRTAAPIAAYVHIPFCRRRCFYCDFPISVVGDRRHGGNSPNIASYVDVLCREIRHTPAVGPPLQTIFFGGGTPSLLTPSQLGQILTTLAQQFDLATEAEISMEIDPGTFDRAQLAGYRAAGVNRVSLGVQAFQETLLRVCGRSHTVADIGAAVTLIQQAGLANYSLDLISGLPHQTLADWAESLQRAIALGPTHLSCYDLTVEPQTPFSRQYQPGVAPLPTDDLTAEMYRLAQQQLTAAGYAHYEISNYAQPGYQCRHNRVYWQNQSFYGFGMGATSYLQGVRFARPRKTHEYREWVEQGQKLPSPEAAALSPRDRLLDTLMVGLRLAEGIAIAPLIAQFGPTLWAQVWDSLAPFQGQGWLTVQPTPPPPQRLPTDGQLRLTDPEGFLFSNVILVKLFARLGDA